MIRKLSRHDWIVQIGREVERKREKERRTSPGSETKDVQLKGKEIQEKEKTVKLK